MFKKLKDKIAEESQTKLQQLAQAAGYNIPASDVNTDSFFSITDETPQNSPLHKSLGKTSTPNYNNGGAAPVRTRRLSNSSQASDISFKLPVYDSELPAVYHLQSDMESASELDEAGSVAAMGGQLDLVSKEQLHGAYKKALDRYQKYRGMYTDLARKYRELERDNTKARAVLVETQDKALRRISELREQCSLEQQAKAHLESALRLEMDEMQCVVKTLTTKLELLGVNAETELNNDKNGENLIQLNNDTASHASSEFSSSQSTDLDKKISDLEAQIKQLKELSMEKDAKIIIITDESKKLREECENLKSNNENNTIQLAENKMVIHSELESKEKEMAQLKSKLEKIENQEKSLTKENQTLAEQLATLKKQLLETKTVNQASKEMLSSQMVELETALKGSRDEKHSLELKFVDVEKELNDLKTEKTTLMEQLAKNKEDRAKLEEQLTTFKTQFGQLQQELKDSLAKNDSLVTKTTEIYQDSFQEKFDGNPENLKKVRELLKEMRLNIETLSKENLAVLEDKTKIEQRLTVLFEEKQKVNVALKEAQEKLEKNEKEIENWRAQATTACSNEDKFKSLQESYEEKLSNLESKLQEKLVSVQGLEEKLQKSEKEVENLRLKVSEAVSNEEKFKVNLNELQQKLQDAQSSNEEDVKSLKIKIQELEVGFRTSEEKFVTELEPINNEMARLRQELVDKTIEMEKLVAEKDKSLAEINKIQSELPIITEKRDNLSSELSKTLEKVTELESKVQNLSQELAEQQNEKQEQESSEVTTLKGKVELLRKEKNDLEKTLEREIREKSELKTQVVNILKEITRLEEQLNEVKASHSKIQSEKEQLEQKFEAFNEKSLKESESTKKLQTEFIELQRQLQENLSEKEVLTSKITQLEQNLAKTADIAETEEQLTNLRAQLTEILAENAKLLEQKELLEHQVRNLQDDVEVKEKEKLTVLDTNQCLVDSVNDSKSQILHLKETISSLQEQKSALTETCDSLMEKVDALKKENISLRSEREQFQQRLEDIQNQLEEANNKHSIRENKIRMLADENKNFKTEMEEKTEKLKTFETENDELRQKLTENKPQEVQEEQFEILKKEINELKSVNSKLSSEVGNVVTNEEEITKVTDERDKLKAKLEEIMKEIAGINSNANDLATRNLFLEQKCENYLILEQSNERLKNQVEKLSRQLDETLVSLHHNEGLAANTEFEYLRNILFQYLSGSAGVNGKTLVKVIAAVLKFTPQQTQVVVEKEAHRHSLVGQINNLL